MARMCADMPCPQWQARITTTPQRASTPACILYSLKQATACTVGGGTFSRSGKYGFTPRSLFSAVQETERVESCTALMELALLAGRCSATQ